MFDPITLDQLRAFVAVVEEGSFSAAARKLRRVQSAISASMANLEAQLGVSLFDRRTKIPRLTETGGVMLGAARRVLAEVDALERLSSSIAGGLEPSVALCVDALFPLSVLLQLCSGFAREFPSVALRLDTQVLSAVTASVLAGTSTLGVVTPPGVAPGLERKRIASARMVTVASPKHPLASTKPRIPTARLAEFVQIVLFERHEQGVPDQGVLATHTWRVADLHTKHAMLVAGLGWGNLPEHLVRDDLRRGRLVVLRLEAYDTAAEELPFYAIYRDNRAFGRAHRWVLAQLEAVSARELSHRRSR
jgi:DNA-binding transcriptional LysR family regulator